MATGLRKEWWKKAGPTSTGPARVGSIVGAQVPGALRSLLLGPALYPGYPSALDTASSHPSGAFSHLAMLLPPRFGLPLVPPINDVIPPATHSSILRGRTGSAAQTKEGSHLKEPMSWEALAGQRGPSGGPQPRKKLGPVAHAYYPSAPEAKAGGPKA